MTSLVFILLHLSARSHSKIIILMPKRICNVLILFITTILGVGCSSGKLDYKLSTKLNPSGINPLAAIITVEADKPCRASFRVLGETEVEQSFEAESKVLEIPIIGLYPNRTNKVIVSLRYSGETVADTIEIQTGPLPNGFPDIEISKINRTKMAILHKVGNIILVH